MCIILILSSCKILKSLKITADRNPWNVTAIETKQQLGVSKMKKYQMPSFRKLGKTTKKRIQ